MTFLIALIIISADNSQDMPVAKDVSEMAVTREPSRAERLAPLASLLLPGTGELIRDYRLKGELFLWGDALAITGAAGFGWNAANTKKASINTAVMYAGSSTTNRSRVYLNAMENFASSDAYNADLAREARSLYPDDLAAQQEYLEAHNFTGEDAWEWQSDSLWTGYVNQRTRMRKASQVSTAFMGIMLLTRLASTFDVAFFSPVGESRLGLVPIPDPINPGLQLVCRF